MTHIENIPHILRYGITHKNSINHNTDFKAIGDLSLISTRNSKSVIVDNGIGSFWGSTFIQLGNFIPFYFGVRMPMLYVIQNGGNFVEKATPPENIVYVVCSLQKIIDYGISFYFSDGHATDNFTSFYDSSMIQNLDEFLDWNAIKAKYWTGEENLIVKRKKQAEFLSGADVPLEAISGYGCYNDVAKNILISFGIEAEKIKIIPKAYF